MIVNGKIPPQAIELEQSVLAGCLLDKNHLENILELLTPGDFYRSAHAKIYQAIMHLCQTEDEVDVRRLTELLKQRGQLEEVGGGVYLFKLMDEPMPVNAEYTCKIIKEKAILRRIIEVSNTAIQRCFEVGGDITVLDLVQQDILAIDSGVNCNAQTIGEIIPEQIERLEKLNKREGYITGISSGFYELDKITCGFQNSDLILLAGRPGMGKTALALNIAINMEAPAVVFSLEMSKNQLVNRALSSEAEINGQKFRSGNFKQTDWYSLTTAAGKLSELPITIIDSPLMSYQDIIKESRRLKKRAGIKMIIIDYLQFIEGDPKLKENYRYAEISKYMKGMAKNLDIPVLVLAQLNRKLEERSNPYKRPRLSDLRDSGALEQDADLIMFLYRPEMYEDKDKQGNEQPGIAEVIIAKHRNGPTGTIRLQWSEEFTKFRNLAR